MSRTAKYMVMGISIIVLFIGYTTSEIRILGIGASILIFPMILSYVAKYKIKNLEEKGKEFQEKLEHFNIKAQKITKFGNAMIRYGFTCLFLGAILLGFILIVVTTV